MIEKRNDFRDFRTSLARQKKKNEEEQQKQACHRKRKKGWILYESKILQSEVHVITL